MDGTLFDSMDPVTDGFIEAIVAAGGPRYTAQDIVGAFPQGWPGPMMSHLLGRPVSDGELGDYHARLDAASAELEPYPGIEDALDVLNERGIRLALFTGADLRSVEILLGRTSIRDRFEVVTGGDEVARAKPAPDGIVLTCRRLGVPEAAAVYVGDSWADMAGGAGPPGCAPSAPGGDACGGPDIEADEVAAAPSDLPRLLDPSRRRVRRGEAPAGAS